MLEQPKKPKKFCFYRLLFKVKEKKKKEKLLLPYIRFRMEKRKERKVFLQS